MEELNLGYTKLDPAGSLRVPALSETLLMLNCLFRDDLIKYYEELSREVEYREFRAQWRIRRRQLDTARAQFLAQEQARLDVLKEQMTQASDAQTPAETAESSVAQPGSKVNEKPATDSERERTTTPISVPSPSIVSLIASGVRTDALLRSEQQMNSAETNTATVDTVESEESNTGALKRKTWDGPNDSAAQLEKLKEEGTGRKTWETPDGEIKIASSLPKSHPSDSSIQFSLYGEKRRSKEEIRTSDSSLHDGTLITSTPHVADSSLQNILYPSAPSVETPGQDAQASSIVTEPSGSDAGVLVMGHPSDSSAQQILYKGSDAPGSSVLRTPSTQMHPSDSSAQHLLYHGSAVEEANFETITSEHGHPSDSSVNTLLYPNTEDTPFPHSHRLSPHGHPSDSQISLSEDSSKAQLLHHSSRSTWQHPSDASVQKLLGDITILGESQQTTRGAPPPSVAQDILYPSMDKETASSLSHTRGTPPHSVAQDILYPGGEGSGQIHGPVHTRGAAPSSVIQDIMYPSGEGTGGGETRLSTRGHEPEVKITKIMYYVKETEGKLYTDEYVLRNCRSPCFLVAPSMNMNKS